MQTKYTLGRDTGKHVTNAMVRDLGDKELSVVKNIMVVGLAEEAGEVAGLLKRELRQFGQKDAERTTKRNGWKSSEMSYGILREWQ